MKIYNCNDVIANINIDFSYVDSDNMIDSGDSIILPYNDTDLLAKIKSLNDDVVFRTNPRWKESDNGRSKCYFSIIGKRIGLLVETFPKRYTADERTLMLHNASCVIREDGYSEYYELYDMFDAIDDILNSTAPIGEMYSYPTEMEEAEMSLLLSLCD